MKLLIVLDRGSHPLMQKLCEAIEGEKIFCSHAEALEKLLTEDPTHVLVDLDGEKKTQETLHDLQQSALAGQRVAAMSWLRLADIGGVEPEGFLRKPFTPQQLAAFLQRED